MTSRALTPTEVHAVGLAAIENALAIMGDAQALAAARRVRRAYTLGMIAAEEVAKSLTCRRLLEQWADAMTVTDLNQALRPKGDAHLQRYIDMLRYLDALGLGALSRALRISDLGTVAKSDMRARERTLYVEVAATGAVMTPDGVSEAEAALWVGAMVGLFDQLGSAWRASMDDALIEAEAKG